LAYSYSFTGETKRKERLIRLDRRATEREPDLIHQVLKGKIEAESDIPSEPEPEPD